MRQEEGNAPFAYERRMLRSPFAWIAAGQVVTGVCALVLAGALEGRFMALAYAVAAVALSTAAATVALAVKRGEKVDPGE